MIVDVSKKILIVGLGLLGGSYARVNGHKPISTDNPRIPTYVCENRLYEGKKEKICVSDEVQTQYRAYKIDDVIDDMIKQLLRRTKALQSGEFINYKYQTEWKRIQKVVLITQRLCIEKNKMKFGLWKIRL